MTTISYRPEVQRARTLRQRLDLDRLDYLRELRRLATVMSQTELAVQLGVKQPTIHSALRTAAKVVEPPGFVTGLRPSNCLDSSPARNALLSSKFLIY